MTTVRDHTLGLFGAALREARQTAGLTQGQLSDRSKVSRRTIIRWEAGEASPWIPELQSVMGVLDMPEAEGASLLALLQTNRGRQASGLKLVERQARLLRIARMRKSLKPEEVGEAMGCDPSTVSRWELGQLIPKPEELNRLWGVLDVTGRELQELSGLDGPVALRAEPDFEERLLGILWPWDKEGYLLFDVRFFNLLEQLTLVAGEGRERLWSHRAKTAYAWMLAICGRYPQAQEHADEVLATLESREVPFASHHIAAALITAKSNCLSGSERGIKRGIKTLDGLEHHALDWEMLACRFDGYAQAYGAQGAYSKALDYSQRAVDSATKCGARLTRLLGFNRSRLHLMSGDVEQALQSLPHFSELTPLNDANEALLFAAIHTSLGRDRQATHWRSVAAGVIDTYHLETVFAGRPDGMWSMPPLIASV